ncbi:hypothetical protein FQV27_12415 [Paracoccus aurantiacus]|uniref:S8 family serine peptidase n=1 Tax=Paracoccus aurantiacus TaxID=2599412 RepID=A0A5C6S2X9_9RHOB|nr:hypothetical protein [Paracoccus aurantiacus]TXB68772.1 hypothetical protein FQV27_12415 [Paracoccus aurantiacus]
MAERDRGPAARNLPHYTGPYERWIFSRDLGRPFAFPSIADGPDRYYAALAEGGLSPDGIAARPPNAIALPPLWNMLGEDLAAVPFVVHRNGEEMPETDGEGPAPGISLTQSGPGPARDGLRARYRLNYPVADRSWVSDYDETLGLADWAEPSRPPKVIVGVIDDGIPFAHRAFLNQHGKTRISHCWLQSGAAGAGRSAVPFGRELMNTQIDALRADHLSEAALYLAAGALDSALPDLGLHLRGRASHGAHIAGICSGNDPCLPGQKVDEDIAIIAVQLPNTVAWDTSGFGKEMYMLSALHYIFHRARLIAGHYAPGPKELPLIVNFSYGWSANRHDGGATMERAFDELVSRRKAIQPATSLNMPMGNNFAKRMHAQITRDDLVDDRQEIGWWLSPDDMTSSYLEIWLPQGFNTKGFRVTVTPPPGFATDGPAVIELRPGQHEGGDPRDFADVAIGGDIVGQLSVDRHFRERWRVMLALIPTSYAHGARRRSPAGEWRIQIEAPFLRADEAVNIWLQRDDDPGVLRSGGRQSHLIAPDRPRADQQGQDDDEPGMLRGYGLFNGISSAPSVTRVAGFDQHSAIPSRYSGAGGVQRINGKVVAWGASPAFAAAADQGQFRPGLPSIGLISGSGVRLQGTSAATAIATRWMAANIAEGRGMTDGLKPLPPLPEEKKDRPVSIVLQRARLGQGLVPTDWG